MKNNTNGDSRIMWIMQNRRNVIKRISDGFDLFANPLLEKSSGLYRFYLHKVKLSSPFYEVLDDIFYVIRNGADYEIEAERYVNSDFYGKVLNFKNLSKDECKRILLARLNARYINGWIAQHSAFIRTDIFDFDFRVNCDTEEQKEKTKWIK